MKTAINVGPEEVNFTGVSIETMTDQMLRIVGATDDRETRFKMIDAISSYGRSMENMEISGCTFYGEGPSQGKDKTD